MDTVSLESQPALYQSVWRRFSDLLSKAAWFPYFFIAVIVVFFRAPTYSNRMFWIDEAVYFVQAGRLRDFPAFLSSYQYIVDTKTQIAFIPYILADAINHDQAFLILHFLGALAVLVSCWLLLLLAGRFLHNVWLGVGAALFWSAYLIFGSLPRLGDYGLNNALIAPLLEYFQTPVILLSFYLLMRYADDPHTRWALISLCGAGAAWAIALLIKPGAALLILVYLAVLFQPVLHKPLNWTLLRRRCIPVGLFLAAAAVPVLFVFLPYLFNSAAQAGLWFNLIDVNRTYASFDPLLSRVGKSVNNLPIVVLVGLPFVALVWLLRARGLIQDRRVAFVFWCLLAALALFIGFLPGRAFPWYQIPTLPLLILAELSALYFLFQLIPTPSYRRAVAATVLLVVGVNLSIVLLMIVRRLADSSNDYYFERDRQHFDLEGLVSYVKQHSRPQDTIWVYYDTPEIYMLANRRAATSDPAGMWLVAAWQEPWFSRTVRELETDQPAVLIGIKESPFRLPTPTSLTAIPQVGDFIARNYTCDENAIRGAIVCLRHPVP